MTARRLDERHIGYDARHVRKIYKRLHPSVPQNMRSFCEIYLLDHGHFPSNRFLFCVHRMDKNGSHKRPKHTPLHCTCRHSRLLRSDGHRWGAVPSLESTMLACLCIADSKKELDSRWIS